MLKNFTGVTLGPRMLAVVSVICFAVLTSNRMLLQKNRDLRDDISRLRQQYTQPPKGISLPPITGFNIAGEPVTFPFGEGEKGTVLLVLSPNCHYCDANWNTWKTLLAFDWFARNRIIFVDVSGTVDEQYLRRHGIESHYVIKRLDPATQLAYNLKITPQTILIGPDSRVMGSWSGMLSTTHLKEIIRAMTA